MHNILEPNGVDYLWDISLKMDEDSRNNLFKVLG